MNKMGKVFSNFALVFGIIGLLGGWLLVLFLPFGELYLPIAAIVFGIIGIITEDSRGLAIAGLVLGVTGIIFVLFALPAILTLILLWLTFL